MTTATIRSVLDNLRYHKEPTQSRDEKQGMKAIGMDGTRKFDKHWRFCSVVVLLGLAACGSASTAPPVENVETTTSSVTEQEALGGISSTDEADILTDMRQMITHYNSGEYVQALRYISDSEISQCGDGALQTAAFAMKKTADIERLRYEIKSVKSWGGGENKADVAVAETPLAGGNSNQITLGLQFSKSGDRWQLNDLWPVYASTYCGN